MSRRGRTLRLRAEDLPAHLRAQLSNSATVPRGTCANAGVERRLKYGNQPTVIDGQRFDSKLEGRYYQDLKHLRRAGLVKWFTRQVPFILPGGVRYRVDFLVVYPDGIEVIDCKGRDTQESRNKRRQVRELYGVEVKLWPAR
jgi:hypothetical protein